MKAILVIDVPNDIKFENNYRANGNLIAEVYNNAFEMGLYFENAILKPMPQKNEIKNEEEFMNVCGWMYEVQTGMDIGWNACIEEILGE